MSRVDDFLRHSRVAGDLGGTLTGVAKVASEIMGPYCQDYKKRILVVESAMNELISRCLSLLACDVLSVSNDFASRFEPDLLKCVKESGVESGRSAHLQTLERAAELNQMLVEIPIQTHWQETLEAVGTWFQWQWRETKPKPVPGYADLITRTSLHEIFHHDHLSIPVERAAFAQHFEAIQHPGFLTSELARLFELSNKTINRLADRAGIPKPKRGGKNHRYSFSEARLMLEVAIRSGANNPEIENAKRALRELETI